MSTAIAWKRLDRFLVDGEVFIADVQETSQGYRVRVAHDEKPFVEEDRTWATLEEAKGRALQMADEMIEQALK